MLVLRALGLGDALVAVPALRGLRRGHPGRPLVLAAHGEPADLLRDGGLVDAVVPTHGLSDAPPGLRLGPGGHRPHTAVNLHGRGPQSHRLLRAGRPDDVVWFAAPEPLDAGLPDGGPRLPAGADGGPAWVEHEHEADRWCRLVASTGAVAEPTDLLLPGVLVDAPPDGAAAGAQGAVVVHPGAADPRRRWPGERWAQVAAALAAAGHRVVVTGGAAERALVADVVAAAGLPAQADLAGRLTLRGLVRLVASAAVLLSADTGAAHLATATATASVVVFGPVPPARWAPRRDPELHAVLWRGRTPAAAAAPDGGLSLVRPADVLAAARPLLAARL